MPRGITKTKKPPGSKRAMKMLAEAMRINRLASPKAAATSPKEATPPAAAAAVSSPLAEPFITPPDQIMPPPNVPPPIRRQDMVAWLLNNASGGL